MRTKIEIRDEMIGLQTELVDLQNNVKTGTNDFKAFNEYRLMYDTIMLRIEMLKAEYNLTDEILTNIIVGE